MAKATIQDWTDSVVLLKFDQHRDVKYQVYRLSLIHISEPTRLVHSSRMPSSA